MSKKIPEITEDLLRQAEELAGYGLSMPQIAAVLGFCERTLHRRKNENESLLAALKRGRARAAAIVGKALFQRAKDGDVPAIRWWEMTREGRSEKNETAHVVDRDEQVSADAEAVLVKLRAMMGGQDGPA
jgi:hypothetical protein